MDIVTQSVLGAAAAQSVAKKEHVRLATLIGLVSGVIADADVFIRSSNDPLLVLEFHRHFTHSIFFIPIGALAAFCILWPFLRKKLPSRFLYLYCFFGYLLSGFIDACTSYGTYLLWPVSDARISWNIVSIVDPAFTLLLLLGVIAGFRTTKTTYCRFGLALAGCYLLFSVFQSHRAEDSIYELAKQRRETIDKIVVKPTFGNILLWRSVYLSNGRFHADVVRAGLSKRVYEGESIEKFSMERTLPNIGANSVLADDIRRFEHFSDGYVSQYPGRKDVLGDVRYSLNPLSVVPLWGIELNPADETQHVKYETYRDVSSETRRQFADMLLNREMSDQR
jgi:inner membrane protein